MQTSGQEKMHQCIINCNNELEVFIRDLFFFFSQALLFSAWHSDISNGALFYCTLRRFLIDNAFILLSQKTKRKKRKENLYFCQWFDWWWTDLMKWLGWYTCLLVRSVLEGRLGVFSPTSSWDGILFTCHWLNVYLKNFMYFSFFFLNFELKVNEKQCLCCQDWLFSVYDLFLHQEIWFVQTADLTVI